MKNNSKKRKNSKKELSQNTELRTFSIRIKDDKLEKELKHILFTYRHFENILLILINQNYNLYRDGKDTNDFNLLTSPQLMRNALYDYNSKNSQQLEYLKNKYKDNQLWQELKEIAKNLKAHNIVEIIKRVRGSYKAYFTNEDGVTIFFIINQFSYNPISNILSNNSSCSSATLSTMLVSNNLFS